MGGDGSGEGRGRMPMSVMAHIQFISLSDTLTCFAPRHASRSAEEVRQIRQHGESKLDDISSNLRKQLRKKEDELVNLGSLHTSTKVCGREGESEGPWTVQHRRRQSVLKPLCSCVPGAPKTSWTPSSLYSAVSAGEEGG